MINNPYLIKTATALKFPSLYLHSRKFIGRNWASIICYHRVDDPMNWPWAMTAITPSNFEQEIKILLRYTEIISLDKLLDLVSYGDPLDRNYAVITFDDGFRDNFLYAYPILKKYDLPATIFLQTSSLDNSKLTWSDQINYACWHYSALNLEINGLGLIKLENNQDRKKLAGTLKTLVKKELVEHREKLFREYMGCIGVDLPEHIGKAFYLSWEDIKEMSANKIDFGAHTVSHRRLSELEDEDMKYEICESKRILEENLRKEVFAFAYPFGSALDYNEKAVRFVREANYKCAVTLKPRIIESNVAQVDLFELPRFLGSRIERFEWNLSGFISDLNRAK